MKDERQLYKFNQAIKEEDAKRILILGIKENRNYWLSKGKLYKPLEVKVDYDRDDFARNLYSVVVFYKVIKVPRFIKFLKQYNEQLSISTKNNKY